MNKQVERLIRENPNISSGKLAKLTGTESHIIRNTKSKMGVKSFWSYQGVGVPFLYFNSSLVAYQVKKSGRHLFAGSFRKAIENVDRLIFCLEKNKGKLPLSRHEFYFKDLEFIKCKNTHV